MLLYHTRNKLQYNSTNSNGLEIQDLGQNSLIMPYVSFLASISVCWRLIMQIIIRTLHVIITDKQDITNVMSLDDIRSHFNIPEDVPVIPTIATE